MKYKHILSVIFVLLAFNLFSEEFVYKEFNFSTGHQGWSGDFSDYPVNQDAFYELAWGWENLPNATEEMSKGMFLSGNNHSDDLFMFIKHQINDLLPDTDYELTFLVTIYTNVPVGSVGIGGSPGESVFVKAGASTQEPVKIPQDNFYYLNVDKGNQSQSGRNAVVIGNLANPLTDPENPQYFPKEMYSEVLIKAKSDGDGRLWIFLGSDSGFEGPSKFYFAKIAMIAKPN